MVLITVSDQPIGYLCLSDSKTVAMSCLIKEYPAYSRLGAIVNTECIPTDLKKYEEYRAIKHVVGARH